MQGLRELRRLHPWTLRKASEKILKYHVDNNRGLQPQGIVGPGGKTMSTQTEATKSAKDDDRNIGGNNGL